MRPVHGHLLIILLVLLLSLAVGVQAQDTHEVHVLVHDEATDCIADEAPCYEIVDDAWSLVSAGDTLELTFENNASAAHALNIAAGANASDERETNRSQAFAQLGPIEPGQTTEASAQIPPGTDTAYLFCHLGSHEAEGLNLLRNVYPAGSVEAGREGGPGLREPGESPTPTSATWVLVGLAAAALVAAGQRRGDR